MKYKQQSAKNARYGFLGQFFYDASAYLSDELKMREQLLLLRQASGLDARLTDTSNPWFRESVSEAFKILHQESWFLSPCFIPLDAPDISHFKLTLSEHHQIWRSLTILKKRVADFALLRAESYDASKYNEPVFYFFEDLLRILGRLAESSDVTFVAANIPKLTQYLQQCSGVINGFTLDDNVFIHEVRQHLNQFIQQDLSQAIDSKSFSAILSQLQSQMEQLGERYHSVLHFSFIATPISPHPYWELFESVTDLKKPGAIQCIALPECPSVIFHPDLSESQKKLYELCLDSLQDLIRLKHMLMHVQKLVENNGEIMLINVFRQDLISLFDETEHYFINLHHNVVALMNENEVLHGKSLIELQTMPFWRSFFGSRKKMIEAFHHNQQQFARLGIHAHTLETMQEGIKESVLKFMSILKHPHSEGIDLLDGPKPEINALLEDGYRWRLKQHQRLGLNKPQTPRLLTDSTTRILEQLPLSMAHVQSNNPIPITANASSTQINSVASMPIPFMLMLTVPVLMALILLVLIIRQCKKSSKNEEESTISSTCYH